MARLSSDSSPAQSTPLQGGFSAASPASRVVLRFRLAYLAFRQPHAHELECSPPACRLNMVEATATWRHEDGRMDRSSHETEPKIWRVRRPLMHHRRFVEDGITRSSLRQRRRRGMPLSGRLVHWICTIVGAAVDLLDTRTVRDTQSSDYEMSR
jgi:hypothetical protein